MNRRLWLSATAAVIGTSMLVAAAFAGAASSTVDAHAKKGGTIKLNMSATDVDFSDPSLAYGTISWQIEFATALKLYNYPDKPKPLGGKIQPEGAVGFPVVSKDGKTYTITVKPGFKFSDGSAVTAANYAFAINRVAQPGHAVAGVGVHHGHRRGAERPRQQGEDRLGREGQGQQADHQAHAAGRRTARQARHAVLPGNQDEHGDGSEGRRRLPVGRPVLHRQPRHRPAHHHEEEQELQGFAPRERRRVRHLGEHEPRPEPAPGEVEPGRLRHREACPRRPTPTSARSTASTRRMGSTTSTRWSRPTTSP